MTANMMVLNITTIITPQNTGEPVITTEKSQTSACKAYFLSLSMVDYSEDSEPNTSMTVLD